MGTSLIRNGTPPEDHHKAQGIVLLQGPREALFLMSVVNLYLLRSHDRTSLGGLLLGRLLDLQAPHEVN